MADVIRSAAPKADIIIDQGATFSIKLTYTDEAGDLIALAGWSSVLQVRSVVDATEVLLEMSTDNGGITLGATDGTIRLFLSKDDTAALAFDAGIYQLELYDTDNNANRLLKGQFIIDKEVVRV